MAVRRTFWTWLEWLTHRFEAVVSATPQREFDDLLNAIVRSFLVARTGVTQRALGMLQPLLHGADPNSPGIVTLQAGPEHVKVPLVGLVPVRFPNLAELSLEFDCVIGKVWTGLGTRTAVRLADASKNGNTCRMKIMVAAEQCLLVEVMLNEQLFRRQEFVVE